MAPRTVSVSQWTLRETDVPRGLARLAAAGYAAVEVGGTSPTPAAGRAAVRAAGLTVTSVCPLLGTEHDLAADDPRARSRAADELRRWADVAEDLDADTVIVVPSDRPTPATDAPRAELLSRCAETLATVVAATNGLTFVIEALNRYETHLVRSLAEAERLRALVGSSRVALMIDTFHLSIEEDNPLTSVREHGGAIRHVHLADNQRREPGSGSLDFAALFAVLDEIGYPGALTMEFLPAGDAALGAARRHVEALTGHDHG